MGVLKPLGVLVAAIAVSLGTVGSLRPELFLKLPGPFGFLLYHIIGGKNLPPYFDTEPFTGDNMFQWVRDGDVVVATGAKTGTTWLCYCTDAVRRKGSDDVGLPYTDIMMTTPWMEFVTRPGETWADRKELYNTTIMPDGTPLKDYWDNKAFPFRVFKSHMMPDDADRKVENVLPIKKNRKVKYISSMREPHQYIKSIFNFFPNHDQNFAVFWGGFPPIYSDMSEVVKDHLPGNPLNGLYIGYAKAWWPYRDDPNVLLLHYSDMVKDLDGLVRKLADFVGVQLTGEEFEAVKEKCSYKHMSANADLFDYRLLFGSDELAGTKTVMQSKKFTSKDSFGDKAAKLSEELKKLWDDTLAKELDPELLKWLRYGGKWGSASAAPAVETA